MPGMGHALCWSMHHLFRHIHLLWTSRCAARSSTWDTASRWSQWRRLASSSGSCPQRGWRYAAHSWTLGRSRRTPSRWTWQAGVLPLAVRAQHVLFGVFAMACMCIPPQWHGRKPSDCVRWRYQGISSQPISACAASLEGYRRIAGGEQRGTLLETETAWLAATKPDLVASDVVPLACAAAAAAGIPAVCISNFTWGVGCPRLAVACYEIGPMLEDSPRTPCTMGIARFDTDYLAFCGMHAAATHAVRITKVHKLEWSGVSYMPGKQVSLTRLL